MESEHRSYTAQLNAKGEITAWLEPPVAQSLASSSDAPVAQSLASSTKAPVGACSITPAVETPRDSGFDKPDPSLAQQLADMSREEKLQRAEEARGYLVKVWRAKAATEKKGRDYRAIVPLECMNGMAALMKVGHVEFIKK